MINITPPHINRFIKRENPAELFFHQFSRVIKCYQNTIKATYEARKVSLYGFPGLFLLFVLYDLFMVCSISCGLHYNTTTRYIHIIPVIMFYRNVLGQELVKAQYIYQPMSPLLQRSRTILKNLKHGIFPVINSAFQLNQYEPYAVT